MKLLERLTLAREASMSDTLEDRYMLHKGGMQRHIDDEDSPSYILHELGMTIVVVGEALLKELRTDPTREDCTCHSADGCRRHGTWRQR